MKYSENTENNCSCHLLDRDSPAKRKKKKKALGSLNIVPLGKCIFPQKVSVFKIILLFDSNQKSDFNNSCHWETCAVAFFLKAPIKSFKAKSVVAAHVLHQLPFFFFFFFFINKISLWAPWGTPSGELIELNCINMAPCMSYQPEHRSLMPSCLRLYGILIPALERDVCFIASSKQLSHGCLFTAKPGLNCKHR